MSYSYELKLDFLRRKNLFCCQKAMLFGFFYFSGVDFPESPVKILPEQPEIADSVLQIAGILMKTQFTLQNTGTGIFLFPETEQRLLVAGRLDLCAGRFESYLNGKECCRNSLLRGAFLSCGHLLSPEKGCHLEFSCRNNYRADQMKNLLSAVGLPSNISRRNQTPIVYIKAGEVIRDFLAKTGSTSQFFDFTNMSIVKSLRNSVNRQVNCENANIDKTVLAAEKHRKAIEFLLDSGYKLPPNYLEIANLRLENPEASLEQLGKLCSPPLSKAGVNHRLKNICRIADDLRQNKADH